MIEAMKQARLDICSAKLCEFNSMSSRHEMIRLMDKAIADLEQAIAEAEKQEALQKLHDENKRLGLYEGVYEQQPVTYIRDVIEGLNENGDPISVEAAELIEKLYFTPPQRQPLTREQVKTLMTATGYDTASPLEQAHFINGLRHAEVAHGIKG